MSMNNRTAVRQTNEPSSHASGLLDFLNRLFIALFVCLLSYGFYFAFKNLDRPLTRVTIGGEFRYIDQQDLTILVNDAISGGFITVNLSALKQQLQEHPWVSRVMIERQWPSHLKIDITEEVPIARWGDQAFLNILGESLHIDDNSHLNKLPLLTAEYGNSTDIMEQYQQLSALLIPTGLTLTELKLDSLGVWHVETNRGIQLIIGRDGISKKIRRLVKVWESGLNSQSDNIKAIDLRYPNGLAVAWREIGLVNTESGGNKTNSNSIQG
jgi:cell division protein FtsQ